MISFRYHVVSLVAVFLALALGIVVGTTALNGPITDDLRQRVDTANGDRAALQQQLDTAQAQGSDAQAFLDDYGASITTGALAGSSVLLVTLPGADADVTSRLTESVTAAGGEVSGTVSMTSDFFNTARASDIKSLVLGGTQPTGLTYPDTDDAVTLGGALLAYVLTGQASDTELTTTVSSFTSLQMLQAAGADQLEPADIVLVNGTGSAADAATATSEATFVSAFQQQGASVVVAGDSASDTAPGVVAAIRADGTLDKTLTTVDNADTSMGRISSVLALRDGAVVGAYGVNAGADSAFPAPTS